MVLILQIQKHNFSFICISKLTLVLHFHGKRIKFIPNYLSKCTSVVFYTKGMQLCIVKINNKLISYTKLIIYWVWSCNMNQFIPIYIISRLLYLVISLPHVIINVDATFKYNVANVRGVLWIDGTVQLCWGKEITCSKFRFILWNSCYCGSFNKILCS